MTLNRLLLVLAFGGIFVTGVLGLGVALDLSPPCGAAGGCDRVSAHPLSRPLGVPLAYIGLVAYLLLTGLVAGRGLRPATWRRSVRAGTWISGMGALASVALTVVSVTRIGALCTWCTASAVLMLLLFSLHLFLPDEPPGRVQRGEPVLLAFLALAALGGIAWQGGAMAAAATRPGGDADRIARTPWAVLAPPDAPALGPASAVVVAVQFTDLACSACRKMHRAAYELLKATDPNLRIVFRHLPQPEIRGHEAALEAAVLAEIAKEQGRFWEFVDVVFAAEEAPTRESLLGQMAALGHDRPLLESRLDDPNDPAARRVQRDLELARRLRIEVTPAFVVLAPGVRPEALPPAGFRRKINEPDLRRLLVPLP
jgi:protein-disulfide isomerase/uncharacterized membrane protein